MAIEEIRMVVCDGERCGAMESMPPPVSNGEEITMMLAPKDWMVVMDSCVKTYCPACKYLYQ